MWRNDDSDLAGYAYDDTWGFQIRKRKLIGDVNMGDVSCGLWH